MMRSQVVALASVMLLSMIAVACSSSSAAPSAASGDDAGDAAASTDALPAPDGDAGVESDAGDSAAPAGPIVAPDDQWTWVDFPTSKCASGTPTGIGVNPHAGSTDVVIYLEGGGACTTADSCWGPNPGANNVAGYDATTFATARQRQYPLLDRAYAGNPLAAMNLVYVPYCTGDMHAGATEVDFTEDGGTIPTYFWGANDMDLFLARVVPTFAGASHVWLYGTSAGGFGTMLDFDRVAHAFGVRVDILDDSGPPITAEGATNNAAIFSAWGYAPPTGCAGCNSLRDVYDFDRQEQPNSRYAFLSFAEDTTIAPDFGYTLAEYPMVLDTFKTSIASDTNAATYIVTNEQSHVVESDLTLAPQYLPWITQMVTDDPAWTGGGYAHP
jgi:hypothetical protein